jgi:chemotaxis protein methyltransferase CheR
MFARSATPLSDLAFRRIRQFFFRHSGIDLPESKRHLVAGRLRGRLASLGLDCYEAYFTLIGQADQAAERQFLIDALTTNETYFFREPQHFQLLAREILPSLAGRRPRLWCAAASSGEEPYSLAMVLSDQLGLDNWELLASDLSSRTLQRAATGLYPMQRLEQFPEPYLKRFCLKGHGEYAGQLLICRELRERVQLRQHNLMDSARDLGRFDVIFLRNVMIYFNLEVKRRVMAQLLPQLNPGGWLILGHAESLFGVDTPLIPISPSVFRLPKAPAPTRKAR